MKFALGICSTAAIIAAAGQANARNYNGSDTLENFTKTLASACGSANPTKYNALAAGEFLYLGGGSTSGGTAMRNGQQDIAPQSRPMNKAEACDTAIELGPEGEQALTIATGSQQQNWAVARDGIAVVTSEANALRGDVIANNPNPGITHADNGTPGADLDDVRADEDDFGAGLSFSSAAVVNCGTYTAKIPLSAATADATVGYAASSTNAAPGVDFTSSIGNPIVSDKQGKVPVALPFTAAGTQVGNANLLGFGTGIYASFPSATTGPTPVNVAGVVVSAPTASSFTSTNCSPTDPATTTYAFTDWKDVLRVLWAGADHVRFSGTNQNATNRQERCGSPVRQGLVSNWDNIIQHLPGVGGGNVAGSCQDATGTGLPLRHIFRRDDSSGTTDTFLTLLGLNAVGGSTNTGDIGVNQPFCNGKDTQDLDPLRVRCTQNSTDTGENDETCGVDQTTGLVLAIRSPSLVGTTNTSPTTAGNRRPALKADLFPTQNCTPGYFPTRKPPEIFNNALRCPDKTPFLFTGCATPAVASVIPPVASTPATTAECNCINAWTNHTAPGKDENAQIGGLQNDGRVWNRIFRGDRTGGHFGTPANQCPVLRDERGDEIVINDSRMRYRTQTVLANVLPADRVCTELDATRGIGCLSRVADCSIGFSGRESIVDVDANPSSTPPIDAYNGGTALLVGPATGTTPFGPSKTQIFASVPGSAGYQLGRKLYFNSIVGIDAIFDPTHPAFTALGGETITPKTLAGGSRFGSAQVGVGPEQAQLMECLLTEDPNVVTSPLHKALQASGFLPVRAAADARPLLDTTVAQTCP